jgi:hypothetical protein
VLKLTFVLFLLLQPIPPRLFQVPDHGRFRMIIPLEWRVSSKSTASPAAAVVHIVPSTGDAFDIRFTTLWLDASARNRTTADSIRSNVKRSADTLLVQSENKSVILEDLQGDQTHGNYFTLADSNPAPGEYRYVTQGSFLTGELLTAFTILHREPNTADLNRALRMLAAATHVP